MRVVKPEKVRSFARRHALAAGALEHWLEVAEAAEWRKLSDVRQFFRTADEVRVASGRLVVIFNVSGNRFRLIAAIHYNRSIVFVLRFLTHAEYSKNRWKDEL